MFYDGNRQSTKRRKEPTLFQYTAGSVEAINKFRITLSRVYGAFQYHTQEWRREGACYPPLYCTMLCACTRVHTYKLLQRML